MGEAAGNLAPLTAALATERLNEAQLASLAELSRRSGTELLSQMIDGFLIRGPELAEVLLRTAEESNDLQRLHFLAHRFKGISGNIGAHRLMTLCEVLERHLEGVPHTPFVLEICRLIQSECSEVAPLLSDRRTTKANRPTRLI